MLPMPGEEGLVLQADPAQAQWRMLFKSQQHPVEGIEPRRSKQGAGILEGNESGVEEGIELGGGGSR